MACSCNFCCSGKTVSISCYDCMSIAFCIQHAMRMRHIFTFGLPDSTILSTFSHERQDFRKKNLNWS